MDSENKGEIIKATCKECKKEFDRKVFNLFGKLMGPHYCPKCTEEFDRKTKADQAEAQRRQREEKWDAICAAIYRDTDPNDKRLNRIALAAVTKWDPSSKRGIGLIGTTGLGKTRCLYLALRRVFDAGRSVAAISHTKFSRVAMDAYSGDGEEKANARMFLRNLHSYDVVLIDDLGKPPSTERADSELEELVEERTSNHRPILWSANGSGEWLIKRFGVDRGEPTVRRLAEFSDVTTL